MSDSPGNSRDIRIVAGFIALMAVLTFAGGTVGGWPIWGLTTWQVYPIWLSGAIAATVVVLAFILSKTAKERADSPPGEPGAARAIWWAIALAVIVLLCIFRTQNHLLGDGLSILDRTIHGVDFAPFSWPNVVLHAVLFKALPGESASNSLLAYQITSTLSALIVLFAMSIVVKEFWSRILALSILLSFGTTQLFAGYVERYPLAFAAMSLFLALAYEDWEKRRIRVATIAILAVALAMHLGSLVLLPLLVAVLIRRNPTPQILKVTRWGALAVVGGGVVAYVVLSQLSGLFIPITATVINPYSLTSGTRWLDLSNVAFLSYPLIFLLPFLASLRKSEDRWFYLAAILPAIGLTVIVDPKLGAIRDWDLMSFAAVPTLMVSILAVIKLVRGNSGSSRLVAALFAAFALLHTGSWVYLNSNWQESYERVKVLVRDDPHYSPAYDSGFANLQWAAVTQEYFGDGPEGILAQERRLAGAPGDAINRHNLAFNHVMVDNWQRANELLTGHWQEYPSTREVTIEIAGVFAHEQNLEELERLYERFVETDSSEVPLFFEIASAKEQRGALDSALAYFDRGLRLSVDTTIAIAAKGAELRIRTDRLEQAQTLLSAISSKTTAEQQGVISAAIRALSKNQNEAALQSLAELKDQH